MCGARRDQRTGPATPTLVVVTPVASPLVSKQARSITSTAFQVARGFAMGTADIVPGVSGGTVALVLGIYDRLIGNIRTGARALKRLLTGDGKGLKESLRDIEWVWLLSLLGGILLAVAALSSVLSNLLDEEPIAMAGLFLGLVVGAIWISTNLLERRDLPTLAVVLGVGAAMFLLLGLREDTEVAEGTAEVVTQPLWAFAAAGAIAICAMILPGISGSFLLVLLGMYTEVLGAVEERDIASLGAFLLGCIAGLALFSTLLSWLLEHYRNWVVAAMIGLMVGSIRVLWPWPNGVHTTQLEAPSGEVVLPIVLALIGAGAVITVERLSSRVGRMPASLT